MARSPLNPADRARGLFLGLALGPGRVNGAPPAGNRGELELAMLVAEELLEQQVDLHRLSGRWIAWWRARPDGANRLTPRTEAALDHLARFDAPAGPGEEADEAAPLTWALPLGVALHAQPRNLVSGTWHTVMLTHPGPHATWGAVALTVAAARLFQGRRDFLPDVAEVLVANDAPPDLLSAIRRIPFVGREELRREGPVPSPALAAVEAALWLAHHEPVLGRGVDWLAGQGPVAVHAAAVGAALLGVRDGEAAFPGEWVTRAGDLAALRGLARRLTVPPVPLD